MAEASGHPGTSNITSSSEGSSVLNQRLRRIGWIAVVVLGLMQTWASRHFMNPDGVSYLDVADKYLQHDWTWAVNAYWSPLYSWMLAAALFVFRPSAYWEYPMVHLVNFFIYLLCFLCFEFLLSQIVRYLGAREGSDEATALLPAWAWQAIGYVLFLWCSLALITIEVVTPDMLVATSLFLICGLLIRIRLYPDRWSTVVFFGLALGFGYLAKAVMFPIAFIFLAACLFAFGRGRRAELRVLVAAVLFLAVSSPFLLALQRAKGRWTFGDSGRLAYAWLIDGTEAYIHWRGNPPGTGKPAHPTTQIFSQPDAFSFRDPIKTTYPPWYDASYWNEGLKGRFNLKGQLIAIRDGLLAYYAVFINSPIGSAMLVSFLVMQLYARRRVWTWLQSIRFWQLLGPALAALGLYVLIHVETRYIGALVLLIWLALLSSVRLGRDDAALRLRRAVVLGFVLVSMIVILAKQGIPAVQAMRDTIKGDRGAASVYWQVADELSRMGIKPGAEVAVIHTGFGSASFWARLARVRIIAEITSGSDMRPRQDVKQFWYSNNEVKGKVIQAIANTGAQAIIADEMPPGVDHQGWQQVGNTGHYIYFLQQESPAATSSSAGK